MMKLINLDSLKLFYKKLKNLFYTKSESDNKYFSKGGGNVDNRISIRSIYSLDAWNVNLKDAGWYTIGNLVPNGKGFGGACLLMIWLGYTDACESYTIALNSAFIRNGNEASIKLLSSSNTGVQLISKVRLVSTNSGSPSDAIYIQIYYTRAVNTDWYSTQYCSIGSAALRAATLQNTIDGYTITKELTLSNATASSLPLDDAPVIMSVPEKETPNNEEATNR